MTSVSLKETMHCRNHPQAGASFTLALQYLTLLEMRILWHEVLSVAEAVFIWSSWFASSMTRPRKRDCGHECDFHAGQRLEELCGTRGDTESRLHHRILPLERSHITPGDLDGQIWATTTETHWQVWQLNEPIKDTLNFSSCSEWKGLRADCIITCEFNCWAEQLGRDAWFSVKQSEMWGTQTSVSLCISVHVSQPPAP